VARGRSARAIAKAQATTVAEVNKALDRFTETTIDDKIRRHTLALELARLDELQETFYARALEGDVACGALITKIIERRCTMLGLYTPQTATLKPRRRGKRQPSASARRSIASVARRIRTICSPRIRKIRPPRIRWPYRARISRCCVFPPIASPVFPRLLLRNLSTKLPIL